MENSARNPYINEVQNNNNPVVYISSLDTFLAKELLRSLLSQNCFVIVYKENNTNDVPYENFPDDKNVFLTHDFRELTEHNIKIEYAYYFLNTVTEENSSTKLAQYFSNTTKHLFINEESEDNSTNNLNKNTDQIEKGRKTHLNLPYIYGPGMDDKDRILKKIESENKQCLYITDAVHLLLKTMFGFISKGEILNFLNEKQIERNDEIGWRAKISKEEGILETKKWTGKTVISKPTEANSNRDKVEIIKIEEENTKDNKNKGGEVIHEKANDNQEKIIENNSAITKNLDKQIQDATNIHKIYLNEVKDNNLQHKKTTMNKNIIKTRLIINKAINKGNSKRKPLVIIGIFIVVFYFIIYPILTVLTSFNKGVANIEAAKTQESKNNYEESLRLIRKAKNNFSTIRTFSIKLEPFSKVIRQDKNITNYQKIGEYGEYVTRGMEGEYVASSGIHALLTGKNITNNEDKDKIINASSVSLKKVNENMAQAQALEKEVDKDTLLKLKQITGANDLQIERNNSLFKYDLLKILPKVIGSNENKKYLLLLQNNYELRPAGGFIGSYGLITFEQGKIFDVKFDDTITIDNQLKGHVWPPTPLLKYLGQPNWYLRDSNWSPDFPTSAQKAEWFFTKETGNKVDGIIAIDLTAMQSILEKTGPIKVPEFEEEITAKNIAIKLMEIESKEGGNTINKKDPMGIIMSKIWDNISSISNKQLDGFIEALLQDLNEKHIQVFMHDSSIQDYLYQKNFDGRLRTIPCGKDECFSDYLEVVDSNVGANKTNYYLKKNLQKVVKIENNGEILSEVIITMNNSSEKSLWPQGTYKSYLRTILPFDSKILQLKIDDKIASFSALREGEASINGIDMINIDIATESATPMTDLPKTSFGIYLEIPIKTTKKISILYKLPQKINVLAKNVQYQLLVQKQAGVGFDPINFSLSYPENLTIIKNSQDIQLMNNKVVANTNLSIDRMFSIQWEKK